MYFYQILDNNFPNQKLNFYKHFALKLSEIFFVHLKLTSFNFTDCFIKQMSWYKEKQSSYGCFRKECHLIFD